MMMIDDKDKEKDADKRLVPAPALPSGFAAQLLQEQFSTEEKLNSLYISYTVYIVFCMMYFVFCSSPNAIFVYVWPQ